MRIRLTRIGKKKRPAYRIVVADSRSPRDGAFLKIIGHYDPMTDPATLEVKEEQAVHWLQRGAQPSEAAGKLLSRVGIMEKAGKPTVTHWVKPDTGKPGKKIQTKAKAEAPAPEAETPVAEADTSEAPPDEKAAPKPGKKIQTKAKAEAPAPEAETPVAEADTSEAPPDEKAAPKAKTTKAKNQEPKPTE